MIIEGGEWGLDKQDRLVAWCGPILVRRPCLNEGGTGSLKRVSQYESEKYVVVDVISYLHHLVDASKDYCDKAARCHTLPQEPPKPKL